jgi:hypothetical protein
MGESSRDPSGGNPTPKRQGRGAAGGGDGGPVRACLVEADGAVRTRMRVKHREGVCLAGELADSSDAQYPSNEHAY